MKQDPTRTGDAAAANAPDEHHGDLRKGAYLRRRAHYQMQAGSPSVSQAGCIAPPSRKSR